MEMAEDAPLPIRFHILFHAAIRAELDRLDEEVRRIEAQPVGAKDFRALGLRCRFLHDVYQYHSRLEDEVRGLAQFVSSPASAGKSLLHAWPAPDRAAESSQRARPRLAPALGGSRAAARCLCAGCGFHSVPASTQICDVWACSLTGCLGGDRLPAGCLFRVLNFSLSPSLGSGRLPIPRAARPKCHPRVRDGAQARGEPGKPVCGQGGKTRHC